MIAVINKKLSHIKTQLNLIINAKRLVMYNY